VSSQTVPSHVQVTCDACKTVYSSEQHSVFGLQLVDKNQTKRYKKWYVLSIGQYRSLEFDLCESCCQQVYSVIKEKMKQLKDTVTLEVSTK